MEWLNPILAFILGVALRIGIPVAATALVIFLLRRLDQRWQAEAENRRNGLLTVPAKPCWEVKGCTQEQREGCQAAAQDKAPCWQFYRDQRGWLRQECLGCDVFLRAPAPA